MTEDNHITTISARGQASVPASVRHDLDLESGDKILWKKTGANTYSIEKAPAIDLAWQQFTASSQTDWNDPGDDIYDEL